MSLDLGLRMGLGSLRGGGFAPGATRAFDFYIDADHGSDSNDGLHWSRPVQTLAALSALMGSTVGVSVALARGSVWRERLTKSQSGVYVGAYGAGPMPMVRCDDVASSNGWTKTGGRTYVYQRTWSHQNSDSIAFPVWEDDETMAVVTSLDGCDSTPGSVYYASTSLITGPQSSTVIYIHPSDDGDPASNGKVYEIPSRIDGVSLFGSSSTIDGIAGKRSMGKDGPIRASGYDSVVKNCFAEDCHTHSIFCETISNCAARNRGIDSLAYVSHHADATGRTCAWSHLYFYAADSALSGTRSNLGIVHANPGTPWALVSLERVFSTGAYGFSSADALAVSINDTFLDDAITGVSVEGALTADNLCIIRNKPGSSTPVETSGERLVSATGSITLTDFKGFLQKQTNGNAELLYAASGVEIDVRSSTIVVDNNGKGGNTFGLLHQGTTTYANMYDCITYDVSIPIAGYTTFVCSADRNVFYRSTFNPEFKIANVDYSNLAAQQAAVPAVNPNSVQSNPLFAGNVYDNVWTLQSGTPADTGGRTAGSRQTISPAYTWAQLNAAWDAGYLGIDGTGI